MKSIASLMKIKNLEVGFVTNEGIIKANQLINLEIKERQVLGLIGETGCGKTILAMAVMRLLPDNVIIKGEINYQGKNLLNLSEEEMRSYRGKDIAMMLQKPSISLNPLLTVGDQIAEIYQYHEKLNRKTSKIKAQEMLSLVGIDPKRDNEYPHQFSGGMKQRIMIAIGLALNPKILIADEPTKGLDSNNKKQIINLFKDLKKDKSIILITHDLEVASQLCDRIAVMYCGEIIELASKRKILQEAKHPFTQGLLGALPANGLKPISGNNPGLINFTSGCRFQNRCNKQTHKCLHQEINLFNTHNHLVRCIQYETN